MSITLYSLGAAEEVTGSKHVLEVDGKSYLIDCGAFQGARAESDRKNRNFGIEADKIEAVILTHGHYDHCGLLPLLVKKGFKGRIYATSATRDLANLIMMDSAHIQARDADYLKRQAGKKGDKFDWQPLFDESDVIQTVNQMVGIGYHQSMLIGNGVELELYDAGHILGSSIAVITVDQNGKKTRIAFSGDLGRKNKPIIRDPDLIPAPDYLIMESTYGDRKHDPADDAMGKLAKITKRMVEKKGTIIIPAFAIERTQELVYYFHLLVDRGILPKNTPIYVDSPMATNATTLFQLHPECYDSEVRDAFIEHHKNPFGFNSLHFTTSVDESKALNNHKRPLIIISASGMCEAGRIQHHLIHNIQDPNTTILVVGFMADNTLGRRLVNREKEVKIHGQWFKVNAQIEEIDGFSAHADYEEMGDWLDEIDTSNLKNVFLVHGEPKEQRAFKSYLEGKGYSNVDIVKYGETYKAD
jgi:metallo-beta-lactamase family protein